MTPSLPEFTPPALQISEPPSPPPTYEEVLATFAGDDCEAYRDRSGKFYLKQDCSFFYFCCGTCENRYCCSSYEKKLSEDKQTWCEVSSNNFGTVVAVGVTLFVLFIVIVVLCFTCSCCCLYKACRSPPQRIIATPATTTTVIHAPYPQQSVGPQAYPAGPYQGYQPVPFQPSPAMPTAPYPAQYPPAYPANVSGPPPPYQEMVPTGTGAAYPPPQLPYNPAYMEPQKPAY
nr:PREDICTED: protein shisa-5 isoform X2 [Latimeria chalumnae]|eukprot:XP_014344455.1 PREDICTED: protein shisa-5 isoform X2 [Latimeria chalumnae]